MATTNPAPNSVVQNLRDWGNHSVPPTLLATLITAQHVRPFQPLPMIFPPLLLFSSYLNVNGYKTDSAGITAAWSGLYGLLSLRRKQTIKNKFTLRGGVRATSLVLCAVNAVGGGLAYTFGKSGREEGGLGKGGGMEEGSL